MQKQEELEIREIIDYLIFKKKTIAVVTLSGLLLGVLIAFTTPEKYEVKVSFLNEQREQNSFGGQGLAGLAGLAGISIPEENLSISPEIYPEILNSASFVKRVEKMEFETAEEEKVSLFTYIRDHQKSSFISKIFSLPSQFFSLFTSSEEKLETEPEPEPVKNEWIFLDSKYLSISSHLKNSLTINNTKAGIIEVSALHQDPLIAGELVENAYNFLTEYIAEYELTKERRKLDFIEKQLETVRTRFLEAQNKLAIFRDRNANIISAQARSEEERLQADYTIAFNVYNAIMVQKEEAQLKLEDKIPAFTVIESIKIPRSPSWPNKKLIIIIAVFLSFIFSVFYLLAIFLLGKLGFTKSSFRS